MARPTILFNNSTGSDTVASGAGPSTALTGTGASLSTSTSVDLSADAPDLSGVATDGTAALFVNTSSGRKYSRITAVDNGTKIVTVATTYSVTESSRTWAIGGKRATLDHADSRRLLTADAQAGWTLEFEDAASAALTTSAITGAVSGDATDGYITIRGASEHIVMDQSANAGHFASTGADNPNYWWFEKLKFTNTNGTKTSADAMTPRGSWVVKNCIFGDATNKLGRAVNTGSGGRLNMIDCEVLQCTLGQAVYCGSNKSKVIGCWIHDNTSVGVQGPFAEEMWLIGNIIEGNGSDGVAWSVGSGSDNIIIWGNTIHGNTGDGIDISGFVAYVRPAFIMNNIITANGGYGINAVSGQSALQGVFDYNNYGTGATANTSGAVNNVTQGTNAVTADPGFAGGDDFSVGTNMKAAGFPDSARNVGADQSSTVSYVDLGAAQREEPAGGSGGGRQGLHAIEAGAV